MSSSLNDWLIVLPARLGSVRLPEKPLIEIGGIPLLARTYKNIETLSHEGATIVAAIDHPKTADLCRRWHIPFCETDPDCVSGTDRVYQVAKKFPQKWIMNLQGDEPFMPHGDLKRLMVRFSHGSYPMGSLAYRNRSAAEFLNPSMVKALLRPGDPQNSHYVAIYFSRSPVPYPRDIGIPPTGPISFWQHLGVYVFQKPSLEEFCALPPSALEQAERLEQLRAVEQGWPIMMLEAQDAGVSIDTAEDLERAVEYMKRQKSTC